MHAVPVGHARGRRRRSRASNLQLLGVTVLTSFGPEDMDDLGYQGTIAELVERRAKKAMEPGIDGIVASPLEAAAVRRITGPDAVLVTPGVRSAGTARATRSASPPRRRRFAMEPATSSLDARSPEPPTPPPKSTEFSWN